MSYYVGLPEASTPDEDGPRARTVRGLPEHGPCLGDGCADCCHLGHAPICTVCLDKGHAWCSVNLNDGQGTRRAWLCLRDYKSAWHAGEIINEEALLTPMSAPELARLLDKGTAA